MERKTKQTLKRYATVAERTLNIGATIIVPVLLYLILEVLTNG